MKDLIYRLESKWGSFETDQHYLKQWDTSNGKKKSYLNVLFNPVASSAIRSAQEAFSCTFHSSLLEFYEQHNGIMLFSESLRIYGVEASDAGLYDPYDIIAQNIDDNIQAYGKQFENYVVFGYYSSCLFCFDKTNLAALYVVDTEQEKVVYTFASITDLLNHYVDYLIDEYDQHGKKIHFDKSLEGLPIANVSLEFI